MYDLMSRRWRHKLLATWSLVALLLAGNVVVPILAHPGRWVILGLSLFLFWSYVTFWLPRRDVLVLPDRLRLRGTFRTLDLPFNQIIAVKLSQMSQHFPAEKLRFNDLTLLSPVYRQSCLLLHLRHYPILPGGYRLWFPRFLFSPDEPALLLAVADWQGLNQAILAARAGKDRLPRTDPPPKRTPLATPLPAARGFPVPAGQDFAPVAASSDSLPAAAPPLLLVAEDNAAMRARLQYVLQPHYRVIMAADGAEALRQAHIHQPDLVLTDLSMPKMDGYALLLAIRGDSDLCATPVVIFTAGDEQEARIRSLEAGADDFLAKPCSDQELRVRVRNLLHVRAQERRLAELNQQLEARIEEQLAELVVNGDLRRFLPQSVAENILSGQIGPAEVFERRVITVLFVDIVSFTALTEVLQPNKLAAILNDYLREMTAIALVHGGMVDKFIGDGLMVLFGAPDVSEPTQQVYAAMQTAVAMLQQVEALGTRWRATLPAELHVRIGISTGHCTIGVFGSDMLKSYTAVGMPVNVASRLQGEANPQGVLCSRATYEHVAHRVRAETRGALRLRGVRELVEAYDILEVLG